jgi:hypothetical protein
MVDLSTGPRFGSRSSPESRGQGDRISDRTASSSIPTDRVRILLNSRYFGSSSLSSSCQIMSLCTAAVSSSLAVRTRCPSGENTALATRLRWPPSLPISAFHTRAVLSQLAVTRVEPERPPIRTRKLAITRGMRIKHGSRIASKYARIDLQKTEIEALSLRYHLVTRGVQSMPPVSPDTFRAIRLVNDMLKSNSYSDAATLKMRFQKN